MTVLSVAYAMMPVYMQIFSSEVPKTACEKLRRISLDELSTRAIRIECMVV